MKTDYKDDIIATGTQRKYAQTTNSDGTVSFTDSTEYQQTGDTFGAKDINATNIEVIAKTNERTDRNMPTPLSKTLRMSFLVGAWQPGPTTR